MTSTKPGAALAPCGCGATDREGRKATAVDPGIKNRNLKRLRRIEGQVRGLSRMVEEDRYCPDVMMQVASVQEALRSVGRELLRNHLRHCVATAVRGGDGKTEEMYEEIVRLMGKLGSGER